MFRKICSVFVFLILTINVVFSLNNIYGESIEIADAEFWQQANDWYEQGKEEYNNTSGGSIDNLTDTNSTMKKIIDDFSNMVNILGTTVIVCVTTFLGIKYIFGSVEGKAEVKDSLLTLVVACIFFFGWNSIWNLIFDSSSSGLIFNKGGYKNVIANVFSTVSLVANILAVGGVIYIGIRYIFAGASGKAELKGKSWMFLLGIVLAFCSVGILNYISAVVNQVFGSL